MILVLPTPAMFGVKVFSDELDRVVARYGIEVHLNSEVTEIDGAAAGRSSPTTRAGTKEAIQLRLHARRAAAVGAGLAQGHAAGRPGQPERLRRGRQAHPATRALPGRLRAR